MINGLKNIGVTSQRITQNKLSLSVCVSYGHLQVSGFHHMVCNTIFSDLEGNTASLQIRFTDHRVRDGKKKRSSDTDKKNCVKQCSDGQYMEQEA